STAALRPTCTGPIAYTAQQFLRDQLVNLKLAANAAGVEEAFVSAIAPGSLEMFCRDQNSYYPTTEKFLEAIADAMREECRAIVDIMLKVNAEAYLVEAGNVRHEHEFKVWRDVKLPAGKILIPGVVSHATDLVEHPELVADRIITFAEVVGRENVIAGTDCGLGGRVHPQIAWAKLRALRDGAAIASKKLWS